MLGDTGRQIFEALLSHFIYIFVFAFAFVFVAIFVFVSLFVCLIVFVSILLSVTNSYVIGQVPAALILHFVFLFVFVTVSVFVFVYCCLSVTNCYVIGHGRCQQHWFLCSRSTPPLPPVALDLLCAAMSLRFYNLKIYLEEVRQMH